MAGVTEVTYPLYDIELDEGVSISPLFNSRITGDYDDFVEYDKPTTDTMFANAKKFVATVKTLI